MTMVKLGQFALLGLLVATLPSCSKDATDEGGSSSLKGTWDVVSFNGDPVPSTVFDDGDCKLIIKSGFFTFRSDGTYTSSASISEACTGQPATTDTETADGTWSTTGSQLTLTDADGFDETFSYSLTGSTLKFNEAGAEMVLKRR